MAHGTLIFSVGVGMTASTINPRAMSYGYDRLRFIKPVFINDTIRASATIKEKRDHPRRASHEMVVEFLEVSNRKRERADLRASVSCRAAGNRYSLVRHPRLGETVEGERREQDHPISDALMWGR